MEGLLCFPKLSEKEAQLSPLGSIQSDGRVTFKGTPPPSGGKALVCRYVGVGRAPVSAYLQSSAFWWLVWCLTVEGSRGLGEQDPTPTPTQNSPIAVGILGQWHVLMAAFLFSAPSHWSPAGWHCQ